MSVERRVRTGDVPRTSDTLLSLPAPASRDDLALEERVVACERGLDELSSRLAKLERQAPAPAPAPEASTPQGPRYWVWLMFLAGLAIAWQILRLSR